MSDRAAPTPPRYAGFAVRAAITLAVVGAIIGAALGPRGFQQVARSFAGARLHAPRLELIASVPLVIQLHLATVLAALVAATILMVGVKGTRLHRTLGWGVAILLFATAIDTLFINGFSGPSFTPLHLFSAFTLVAVPAGVLAARQHKVVRHRRTMGGLYFGGLILAGLIAFMPGRLMWNVFFG